MCFYWTFISSRQYPHTTFLMIVGDDIACDNILCPTSLTHALIEPSDDTL